MADQLSQEWETETKFVIVSDRNRSEYFSLTVFVVVALCCIIFVYAILFGAFACYSSIQVGNVQWTIDNLLESNWKVDEFE